ncbi:hypothetical protein LXA43DRAFT_1087872 [Ganoderma leucocontextum]|nr:hypothetical protein LXA43DRAFT_1087872 [Ganoderma leucocontextum]
MGEVEAHKEGPVRELFESKFWGAAKVTSEAVRFFREVNNPVGGRLNAPSFVDHGFTGLIGGPGLSYYSAFKHGTTGISILACIRGRSLQLADVAMRSRATLNLWPLSSTHHGTSKSRPSIRQASIPRAKRRRPGRSHPAYSSPDLPATRMHNGWATYAPPGDVNKAVEVIYRLASEPDPPLRLLLGESAHTYLKQKITRLAADMEKYASWSENLKKDGL